MHADDHDEPIDECEQDDNEVTISEEGGVRYLHFGTEWIQGAMRINKPDAIEIDYVQNMMAWMLFLAPPPRILQLGLGAAALTKFCYRNLSATSTTVVELSAKVHQVAQRWFSLPDDDARLSVVIADAMQFLQQSPLGQYAVIQVDLYDQHARGPALESMAFYRSCRAALAEPGILVVNLFGQEDSYQRNIDRLKRVFGGRIALLPAVAAGNIVVLCFAGARLQVERDRLLQRAKQVQATYRLPAIFWASAICRQIPLGETTLAI
jgi:spermidine synthase